MNPSLSIFLVLATQPILLPTPLVGQEGQLDPTSRPDVTDVKLPVDGPALAIELEAMMKLDQLYRTQVQWGTTDPDELARLEALDDQATLQEWARRHREGVSLPRALEKELMAKQTIIDERNVQRLGEIIRDHGYPDPERLGLDCMDPLPVLIHASLEDYRILADDLLKEARAGRLDAKAYAALFDRKRQHAGGVQLYGTCLALDASTGQELPPEIEDIEATNRARAEIGLPPLERYRTRQAAR